MLRTVPVASIRYSAGQYWLRYAVQVASLLSTAIGYVTPRLFAPALMLPRSRSNTNSGACTPITCSPAD